MKIAKYYNTKLFEFICLCFKKYIDWKSISANKLSFNFIKKFKDDIHLNIFLENNNVNENELENILDLYNINYLDYVWVSILRNCKVSENFIEKYYKYLNLEDLYSFVSLSENFIERHIKDLDNTLWEHISYNQNLSENFIEKYKYKLNWYSISKRQILSEDFIENHSEIYWSEIQKYQKLSENFLNKYFNKLDLNAILCNQKLSDDFLIKHFNSLNSENYLYNIVIYQKLSESFIENYILKSNFATHTVLSNLIIYQNISKNLYNKHKVIFNKYKYELENFNKLNDNIIIKDNWLYKDTKFKKKQIIDSGLYECYDDYFIAYKAIRQNRYSLYNFQYKYEPGKLYESKCDCTDNENSFGLNVGTYKYAKNYGHTNSLIVKCKIKYEDIGRLVHVNKKVRCFKIEILD